MGRRQDKGRSGGLKAVPRPRNLQVVAMRRLGHKVKPSAKQYSRKGRVRDPAFSSCGGVNRPDPSVSAA